MQRKSQWSTRALVPSLVALAVLVAACSSSSSPSSSRGASVKNSGASAPGVTATSITIGGILTKTSAAGYSQANADLGARAYFEEVNAAGGIYGRKIHYIGALDDGLNPSTDLTDAQSLVQQDNVFAVDPVVTPVFEGGTYLVQQGVPFFGWGIDPAFCNNQYGFGFTGCLVPSSSQDKVSTAGGALLGPVLGGTKGKTVALISENDESGTFGLTVIKAALVATGFDLTYAQASLPSGTVTDYTPYVHAIMTSNHGGPPEVMWNETITPHVIGLMQALRADGFKGIGIDAVNYLPSLLQDPQARAALQGEYVFIQFEPLQANTPAIKQMISALRKTSGNPNLVPDESMAIGYWSAADLVAALKKTGPDLTRASFLRAANTNFSFGVAGGVGTITYPADHEESAPCGALVQIEGSSFVPKVPLTCYTNVPLTLGE
jgi:branched-chain amino acid transport system substrate-binding protein